MSIIELIETFLDPILSTAFGGVLLSVGFIAFLTVALGLLNLPKVSILTTVIVLLLMFVSFGWLPLWLIILLTLTFFGLFLLNMRGGSNA